MSLRQLLKRNAYIHAALLPMVSAGRRWRGWWLATRAAREEAWRARRFARVRAWCHHASQRHPKPVFVKVGANDGITGDPCSQILLDHQNWHGLLIEPVPSCAARLRANFSDSRFTILQYAVSNVPGTLPFYAVDEAAARAALGELPEWFDQLGSFDRAHILKHLEGTLEPYIRTLDVQVRRLDALLGEQRITALQLLHIDTEGHDLRVLQSLDFARTRPEAILIEHKHLSLSDRAELTSLLRRHGYRWMDCGTDLFATSR